MMDNLLKFLIFLCFALMFYIGYIQWNLQEELNPPPRSCEAALTSAESPSDSIHILLNPPCRDKDV